MEILVFEWKKSVVEISVIFIIDLPKYHFLHQTEDNPSFDYFDVLVSDILCLNLFKNEEFEFWIMNLNFLTPVEDDTSSDDYTRLPSNNVTDLCFLLWLKFYRP